MSLEIRESDTAIIKAAPYLFVRSGILEGASEALKTGQVTSIGRAPTNQLMIPDELCSRNHCEVFFEGGSWRLHDLGSRLGFIPFGPFQGRKDVFLFNQINRDWSITGGRDRKCRGRIGSSQR